MRDILEIFAAVLAVWGAYTLIRALRFVLIFPRRVRNTLRAAVIYNDTQRPEAQAYAAYLAKEGKISSKRLIILTKDDIMEDSPDAETSENKMLK